MVPDLEAEASTKLDAKLAFGFTTVTGVTAKLTIGTGVEEFLFTFTDGSEIGPWKAANICNICVRTAVEMASTCVAKASPGGGGLADREDQVQSPSVRRWPGRNCSVHQPYVASTADMHC